MTINRIKGLVLGASNGNPNIIVIIGMDTDFVDRGR